MKKQYARSIETVKRELHFIEIKKAILEIIYVLLNMPITQKDRNNKLVAILDTG